ncbi:endoribonuclease L-PSP [Coccidioides immitis RS]|uniref:Endoribonuclease L-PSP n=1 Tax=Coccidioides immitis (strain RS) TaxID=246410 RepID=J3K404_COCIM|nr:endoribonuclease L-PSP [Coccidioides immitis RS]EAS28991.3 endoribonuclease L-PSP [Coccidioides immitis RS]
MFKRVLAPQRLSQRLLLTTPLRHQTVPRTFHSSIDPQSRRTMAEMSKVFTTEACPPAGPYSQAIKANGQIFVSGQIPFDSSAKHVGGTIAEQTEQCCKNVAAVLAAAGSSLDKVVKVNVFLVDMGDFKEMNGVFEKYFAHKPARSCVAVRELPAKVPVEIECIALA